MPLMLARKPWFCISIADGTPAKCAPAETPTPSSSFARRTIIISGPSSAIRIRGTSHVSGREDIIRMPEAFSASYTSFEFSSDTGIRGDHSGVERSLARVGLCFSVFFFLSSGPRRVALGVPTRSRARDFTALVALNLLFLRILLATLAPEDVQ